MLASVWRKRLAQREVLAVHWLITDFSFVHAHPEMAPVFQMSSLTNPDFICVPACALYERFVGELPNNNDAHNWMAEGYELRIRSWKPINLSNVTCKHCVAVIDRPNTLAFT